MRPTYPRAWIACGATVLVVSALGMDGCSAFSGSDSSAGSTDAAQSSDDGNGTDGASQGDGAQSPEAAPVVPVLDAAPDVGGMCPQNHFVKSAEDFTGVTATVAGWTLVPGTGVTQGPDTGSYGKASPSWKVSTATKVKDAHAYLEKSAVFGTPGAAIETSFAFRVAQPAAVDYAEVGCTLSFPVGAKYSVVAIAFQSQGPDLTPLLATSQEGKSATFTPFSAGASDVTKFLTGTLSVIVSDTSLAVYATITNTDGLVKTASTSIPTSTKAIQALIQCGSTSFTSNDTLDLYVDDIFINACQ